MGDSLSDFPQVFFGDALVDGQMLGKAQTSTVPHIAAPDASSFHLYTVIMYDPDAPSPDSPICRVSAVCLSLSPRRQKRSRTLPTLQAPSAAC